MNSSNAFDADVIVIGSGFGGAIAANRLALAGHKVLVLERGPWRDSLPVRSMGITERAPFPYGWKALTHFLRTLQIGRRSLTLNKSGMYEVFSFPGLRIAATSGVGGGSHAWSGFMETPENPAYWHDRHPQLQAAEVERYYAKVRADMGAAAPLPPAPAGYASIDALLPATDHVRCRPHEQQPLVALKFSSTHTQAVTAGDAGQAVQRQDCAYDGDSFLGSRGGAKASVDFVYLAPVLNKGVKVRDLCEVSRIIPEQGNPGGGYAVQFTDLRSGQTQRLRAQRVVLAAGMMNTLRLLFASSRTSGGLTAMPSLGRTVGANGESVGLWFKDSAAPNIFKSAPTPGRLKVDGQDLPYLVMVGLPGIDQLPLPPGVKGKLAKSYPVGGMGVDDGKGAVSFEKGRVVFDYDPDQQPIYQQIRDAFDVLEAESGFKIWSPKTPITIHQWGGACLGKDAAHGVVDHNGEIYGNPGLFITDGSALPAAIGKPPSLTLAAWAHYVADRLAKSMHALTHY